MSGRLRVLTGRRFGPRHDAPADLSLRTGYGHASGPGGVRLRGPLSL